MICSQCGKEFTVLYPDMWRYRVRSKWFCTWKCLRADEKGDKEMPRMKKDGTPAKKPGPRKKSALENMPVNLERDKMVLEQLERKDKEEERMRQEMIGKPIYIKPQGRFIKKDEYEKTLDKLETEVAASLNEDVPMTAEERSEKYPMIPTRIDTKAGTWEIFGEYKGDNTLLGYTMKYDNGATPFRDSLRIVMTVEEWQTVCEQLDEVQRMMKL